MENWCISASNPLTVVLGRENTRYRPLHFANNPVPGTRPKIPRTLKGTSPYMAELIPLCIDNIATKLLLIFKIMDPGF
jgi:hypothetical protein